MKDNFSDEDDEDFGLFRGCFNAIAIQFILVIFIVLIIYIIVKWW